MDKIEMVYQEIKQRKHGMDRIEQVIGELKEENDMLKKHLRKHSEKGPQSSVPKADNDIRFDSILGEMSMLQSKKNKDYGNSFDKSLDEDGLLVAKIRLSDKFNRFIRLIKNPAEVNDETIRDTLIDLSVYAAKTVAWMDNQDKTPNVWADGIKLEPSDYITPHEMHDSNRPEWEETRHDDSLDSIAHAVGVMNDVGLRFPGADYDGDSVLVIKDKAVVKTPNSVRESKGLEPIEDFGSRKYYE